MGQLQALLELPGLDREELIRALGGRKKGAEDALAKAEAHLASAVRPDATPRRFFSLQHQVRAVM